MRKLSDIALLIFLLYAMSGCGQRKIEDTAVSVEVTEADKFETNK